MLIDSSELARDPAACALVREVACENSAAASTKQNVAFMRSPIPSQGMKNRTSFIELSQYIYSPLMTSVLSIEEGELIASSAMHIERAVLSQSAPAIRH
jgi:hypothetical protein